MLYDKNANLYTELVRIPRREVKENIDSLIGGRELKEVIDRKGMEILTMLNPETLEEIEKFYPGIIQKIPFKIALRKRNISVLEKNQKLYFQEGWEESVKEILLWDYDKLCGREFSAINDSNAREIYNLLKMLEWIEQNVGTLPPIKELTRFCSKIEWGIYERENICERLNSESLDISVLRWLERLRKITGNHTFIVKNVQELNYWICEQIKKAKYDELIVNLGEIPVYWKGSMEFFHICETENIRVMQPETLKREFLIEVLMKNCAGNSARQENFCKMYRNNLGSVECLYQWSPDNLIYMEKYKYVILEYLKELEIK